MSSRWWEGFRLACKRTERGLSLTIVGRRIPSFATLADKLTELIGQTPGIVWESDIDANGLENTMETLTSPCFRLWKKALGCRSPRAFGTRCHA